MAIRMTHHHRRALRQALAANNRGNPMRFSLKSMDDLVWGGLAKKVGPEAYWLTDEGRRLAGQTPTGSGEESGS